MRERIIETARELGRRLDLQEAHPFTLISKGRALVVREGASMRMEFGAGGMASFTAHEDSEEARAALEKFARTVEAASSNGLYSVSAAQMIIDETRTAFSLPPMNLVLSWAQTVFVPLGGDQVVYRAGPRRLIIACEPQNLTASVETKAPSGVQHVWLARDLGDSSSWTATVANGAEFRARARALATWVAGHWGQIENFHSPHRGS